MYSPCHKPLLAEAIKMQRNPTDSADRTGDVSHCVFISDRQTIRRLSQCLSGLFVYREVSGSDKVTWMKNVVFMSSLKKGPSAYSHWFIHTLLSIWITITLKFEGGKIVPAPSKWILVKFNLSSGITKLHWKSQPLLPIFNNEATWNFATITTLT